jgi:hypothetical protein
MSDKFIPFAAAGVPVQSPAGFQARVLAQPAGAKPFVPAAEAIAAGAHACNIEPRVTVRRDGNRITHVEIRCACGRHLELECVY